MTNAVNYDGVNQGPHDLVDVNPTLMGPAYGNFHLWVGSPAIDAGSDAAAPALDFEGHARPFDGNGDGAAHADIGADEATGFDVLPYYLPLITRD